MLTAVTPDTLAPQGHPLRRIKAMVDSAVAALSSTFGGDVRLNRAAVYPSHPNIF